MNTYPFYNLNKVDSRLIAVITLLCFVATTRVAAQNIQAIEVRDTGFMVPGFYRVFFIDDYFVYQSQIHTSTSQITSHIDSATNEPIFEDSLISTGWNSRYFVFHRDSTYGYNFSPHKMYLPPRIAIEKGSKDMTGSNEFEKFLLHKPDSVFANADSSERQEVYLTPEKPDTPAIRITLSYSRKLNHIHYSLNRVIDAEKKMKLHKVTVTIAAFYEPKSKTNFPGYSFITEMHVLPPELPQEILFFLNWYKDIVQPSKTAL